MALSTGVATIIVGADSLKDLIEEAGGLSLPDDASLVVGGFRMNADNELEFQVAWDACDGHPSDWADAPAFIADTEDRRKVKWVGDLIELLNRVVAANDSDELHDVEVLVVNHIDEFEDALLKLKQFELGSDGG